MPLNDTIAVPVAGTTMVGSIAWFAVSILRRTKEIDNRRDQLADVEMALAREREARAFAERDRACAETERERAERERAEAQAAACRLQVEKLTRELEECRAQRR